MANKFLISTFVVLSILKLTIAQVNLQCTFQISGLDYDCLINGAVVADNENLNFVFVGTHQPGRNDGMVTRLSITASLKPFIIRSAFTSFTNLRVYTCANSVGHNTMRLQANAFQGAANLHEIIVISSGLNNIDATSLQGAVNVRTLHLQNNRLDSLPASLLHALVHLTDINLSNNLISEIPQNFFQHSAAITTVNLNNNVLTRLSAPIFPSNSQLIQFQSQNNRIDAISNRFLTGLSFLRTLNLSGNVCTSLNANNIGTDTTLASIHEALNVCYTNYGGASETRTFRMNLRGTLTLYRNGTVIGRL